MGRERQPLNFVVLEFSMSSHHIAKDLELQSVYCTKAYYTRIQEGLARLKGSLPAMEGTAPSAASSN